jgi:hypothetical protein
MNQSLVPYAAYGRSLSSAPRAVAGDAEGPATVGMDEAVIDPSRPDPARVRQAFFAYQKVQHSAPFDRRLPPGVMARYSL